MSPVAPLAVLDRAASVAAGTELADIVATGASLGEVAIREVTEDHDQLARSRLDLALRVLIGQEWSSHCRDVGSGVVVTVSWPLPARGYILCRLGRPVSMVLVIGRAGGLVPDVWRAHAGDSTDGLAVRMLDLAERIC